MKLLITAVVLFVTSFFLPSYDNGNGFDCAKFCAFEVWEDFNLVGILYYFPFTFSNAFMVIMALPRFGGQVVNA
jgi:hypothetical protein